MHGRLILYKRIANATSPEDLEDLYAEFVDRFGLLPDPLRHLFKVTELRLKLLPLGIQRLDLGEQGGTIEFSADTPVDPFSVIQLVQNEPSTFRLDGATTLRITRKLTAFDERIEYAYRLLDKLSLKAAANDVAASA